jgi:hypothetical protein
MRTRSQILDVIIDFDEASAAWKENKIAKGNGTYTYRCCAALRNGAPCSQRAMDRADFCKRHSKSICMGERP